MKIEEDIKKAMKQELDDSELEWVQGGFEQDDDQCWSDYTEWCMADYYCYTVYNHSGEQDKHTACVKDYMCLEVYSGICMLLWDN